MNYIRKKKTLLILDGDIISYQMSCSKEMVCIWGRGEDEVYYSFNKRDLSNAIDSTIRQLTSKFKADKTYVCLSDKESNFRKVIFPEYKAQRKKLRKPVGLSYAVDYLRKNHVTKCFSSLEADDLMGIIATDPRITDEYNVTLVSIDKDMGQIPNCKWYNPKSRVTKTSTVKECDRLHLYQTLCGDTVDNYKGASKIGPKKANKELDYCEEKGYNSLHTWEHLVEKCFNKDDEYALTQARCAKILRYEDYDFAKKEVKLWEPIVK
jgi:DNA polymerase-1